MSEDECVQVHEEHARQTAGSGESLHEERLKIMAPACERIITQVLTHSQRQAFIRKKPTSHKPKNEQLRFMDLRPITANASQIMVEQLATLGVKYVFNNSGSREARFFDALNSHPDIHGILGLHEGSVAAMAGGYAQVKLDPAVMLVHLGAGLAQCLGQFYNVWYGSLPVVLITFAGDTGSYADRVGLDLSHSFAPTSIAAPMTKATWSVLEPEGLPQATYRAIQVAKTPPVGPVHLAV